MIESSILEAKPIDSNGNKIIYGKLIQLKNYNEKFRIEIEKNKHGSRIIKTQNLKITFINRYIMEIEAFFNNLVNDIEVESIYTIQKNNPFDFTKTDEEVEINRLQKIDEAINLQTKMFIYLDDCHIIIPKNSTDHSKLEIFFDNLVLVKELVKKKVKMPDPSMEIILNEEKTLISEDFIHPELITDEVLAQYLKLQFDNIGVHSVIEGNKGFLLRLNDVAIEMFKGFKKLQKDDNWQFNQTVDVNFKSMNLMDIEEVSCNLYLEKTGTYFKIH